MTVRPERPKNRCDSDNERELSRTKLRIELRVEIFSRRRMRRFLPDNDSCNLKESDVLSAKQSPAFYAEAPRRRMHANPIGKRIFLTRSLTVMD